MTLHFLICLTSILVLGNALALTEEQRAEGRALLASYTAEEDSAKRLDLLRELVELDSAIGDVMWKRVSVEWKTAWSEYQKQLFGLCGAFQRHGDLWVFRPPIAGKWQRDDEEADCEGGDDRFKREHCGWQTDASICKRGMVA
jgi:hypothetical protein